MSNMRGKASFCSPVSFLNNRSIGSYHKKESVLISNRLENAKNLFKKDLKGHFGCVNAIEFANGGGEWIASGGDDMRVLLWNTEKAMDDVCKPVAMKGQHHSNIFCLAFDNSNRKIFSGGNDEQVIVHDVNSGETKDVYTHNDAVYGLSVDPFCDHVFASACDDGRVLIFDTRAPASEDPFCLANYMSAMHAVMFNPVEPRLVATANAREGLGLWDVRKPRTCLLRYGGSLSQQSCMSVRISRDGTRVIGLRRRLPPVLYDIHATQALYHFDHSGYYNSCTMKSCCFAGDNDQKQTPKPPESSPVIETAPGIAPSRSSYTEKEYIISGSDDFNLYVWKIPDENSEALWVGEAHLVLKGHRSIVNQVRFNPSNQLIISSGVEKVVKMWSPYALPNSTGELGIGPPDLYSERAIYSHEEYIHLVLHSGQIMSHDYSNQSTEEDPRMMAFFDSLVQRELENWSSSEESIDSTGGLYDSYVYSGSPSSQSQEDASSATLSDPASVLIPLEMSHNETGEAREDGEDESLVENEEPFILDMDIHAADQRMVDGDLPMLDSLGALSVARSSNDIIPQPTIEPVSETNVQNVSYNDTSMNSSLSSSSSSNTSTDSTPSTSQSSSQTSTDITPNSSTHSIASTSSASAPTMRRRVTIIQSEHDTPNTRDSGLGDTLNTSADENRRTSISNLIKMKRREYLDGIKKLEKKALRRKKLMRERRKQKIRKIIKARQGTDVSSSDSGSESEDSSLPCTPVNLGNSSSNVLNEIAAERQNRLQGTERLKRLRSMILNSDHESDHDNLPSHSTPKTVVHSSPLNLSLKGECSSFKPYIPPAVYEDISNDSDDEPCSQHIATVSEPVVTLNGLSNLDQQQPLPATSCSSNLDTQQVSALNCASRSVVPLNQTESSVNGTDTKCSNGRQKEHSDGTGIALCVVKSSISNSDKTVSDKSITNGDETCDNTSSNSMQICHNGNQCKAGTSSSASNGKLSFASFSNGATSGATETEVCDVDNTKSKPQFKKSKFNKSNRNYRK